MKEDTLLLRKQYLKMLFPLLFSVLGGTINSLVDSVLVSWKLGNIGLAAINGSLPVSLVLCTFGALFAGGAWIVASMEVGEEKLDEASKIYHSALLLSVIVGAAVTACGVFGNSFLVSLFVPGGELYQAVKAYTLVSFFGTIPCMLMYFIGFFLQLEGKGKEISMSIFLMITTDIIMDVVLLYIFPMGMYGASLASVLANIAFCGYGFFMLQKKGSNFPIKSWMLKLYRLPEIIKAGTAVASGNFYDAIRLLVINSVILSVYGTKVMATWAIINVLSELLLCISSGVPQAAGSMQGVYYVSRENSRIRTLVKLQLQIGSLMAFVVTMCMVLFHKPIRDVFQGPQPLLIPLVCLGVTLWFHLVAEVWGGLFRSTKRVLLANGQVALRRLLTPLMVLACIVMLHGYVWLFLPISGALTIAIMKVWTYFVAKRAEKTERPLSKILLLDDYLTRHNKVIDFSIKADMKQACEASEKIADFCAENNMSPKHMIKIQLAIEEFIGVLIAENKKAKDIDARAYVFDDIIGVQFRYAGDRYNPFEDENSEHEMELMILKKLGEEFWHNYTLGLNTIHFCFLPSK